MTVLQPPSTPQTFPPPNRPTVQGKFLFVGGDKLYIRGVTYGTFRPRVGSDEYPDTEQVERDFAQMAANGVNAVRTYTVPPRWLLDAAQRHGLYVMVGLPWEQHVVLDDERRARGIEERVRAGVRACAGQPAVLCYAIGNEIPASIVRWHGPEYVERYLERLARAVRSEDPGSLVTYVNYPTTEYLRLPFIDFVCFNVYLETRDSFEAYLARLHNIAGDRPLVLGELGLDSRTNGEDAQAEALAWQLRSAYGSGCAGAFVFAWTDEWHRGGYDIEDWDFGLTRRDRSPKPALEAVRGAFMEVPFPHDLPWPRASVVVCTHNGARTLRDCLDGLLELQYPDFEVIVVDDGSTDQSAAIAREYPFRLIQTENRGLSSARNTGMEAATGEIVAYTDDDARPDPQWLTYLAATFIKTAHAGVGGPNIAPPGGGSIADCVANAPGGPVHVLLSDTVAEHIPGCNMAFRKECLQAIEGFDPRFRAAGDDVDVCWRLQDRGWTLGFSPAAMVWHHRRNSLRAYWRQQQGYGKAEALLEGKWPERYNAAGHVSWQGRLYGKGLTQMLASPRRRIYHGTWGSALFQSVYGPAPSTYWSLSLMPEWYLVIATLAALSVLGLLWRPLLLAVPLLVLAAGAPILQACLSASRASLTSAPPSRVQRLWLQALTALLHLLQPLARLRGRVRYGLVPWRRRGDSVLTLPRTHPVALWSEQWTPPEKRLEALQESLRSAGSVVLRGGAYDRWDLYVRGGLLGGARLLMGVEEHGAGRQLVRFRVWPYYSSGGTLIALLFAALALLAAFDGSPVVAVILGAVPVLLLGRALYECASATGAILSILPTMEGSVVEVKRQ